MVNQITFWIGKVKDMAIVLDHVHLFYTLNGIHSQLLESVLQHVEYIITHTTHTYTHTCTHTHTHTRTHTHTHTHARTHAHTSSLSVNILENSPTPSTTHGYTYLSYPPSSTQFLLVTSCHQWQSYAQPSSFSVQFPTPI